METVKNIFTDQVNYNGNFQYRDMHFNKSCAVKIMLYARFMIVNKTKRDQICDKQIIKSKENDYLMYDLSKQYNKNGKKSYKIKFRVEGY